jgi:hypothetical protein
LYFKKKFVEGRVVIKKNELIYEREILNIYVSNNYLILKNNEKNDMLVYIKLNPNTII